MSGPLEYQRLQKKTTPSLSRRPQQISFIGSMSVLVGIIGIFSAIGWGSWCVWIHRQSAVAPTISVAQGQPRTIPQSTSKVKFLRLLLERQPINEARLHLLDALIANTGEVISSSSVVLDHGRLPSASGDRPQYFEFKCGRVEIYDTHAIFRPASGATVRITPDDIVDTRFASSLTPADMKILMNEMSQLAGDGLSSQQVQAIRSLFTAGAQKLIDASRPMAGQIVDVRINDDEATVRTQTGWVRLKKDGTVTRSGSGTTKTSSAGSMLPLALCCGVCAINLPLASALLVLGIATLQQKLWTRKWLMNYAIAKIILSIVGVGAIAWFTAHFADELSDHAIYPLLAWAAAIVFPVLLLLLLNRQQVKDYYLKADPFEA